MADQYWLYIMASGKNGTLYVGTTSNLSARVTAHREDRGAAFVRKYGVKRLVYYEEAGTYDEARLREARVKKWLRRWKIELFEGLNPEWEDLYQTLI